ncbi:hypothetical protein HY605_01990 [Candidatus Peregrinibacteria bacterium]|nr:hypothetical protein [Candidatus Peregrinibacteria bacterium]
MKTLPVVVFSLVLGACASSAIVKPQVVAQQPQSQWPGAKRFATFQESMDAVEADRAQAAVVFVMADWCHACQATMKFWEKRGATPAQFYVVNADTMPKEEVIGLMILGIPSSVPTCLIFKQEPRGLSYGLGSQDCTEGLLDVFGKK